MVNLIVQDMSKVQLQEPHFVIYYRLPAEVSWDRIMSRNRAAEVGSIDKEYVSKICEMHDMYFLGETNTFTIDATQTIEEIQKQTKETLLTILKCRAVNLRLR